MNIQWFPGHMAKTKRLIKEEVKFIDVVIELVDARIPVSSRNPLLDELVKAKPRIIILNKKDLADNNITELWLKHYNKQENYKAFSLNSIQNTEDAIKKLKKALLELTMEKRERQKAKGIKKTMIKGMIVGIPNVGKSTFINLIAKNKVAKTGNKPGVTKGKQWIKLDESINLLDTPGILWSKFTDPLVGFNLAVTGSIKDDVLDIDTIALRLIDFLKKNYPLLLIERYKLEENDLEKEPLEIMEKMACNRGCLRKGKEIDYGRIATIVITEFRSGKIGRISLEKPCEQDD